MNQIQIFFFYALAGWVNREQQKVIDYLLLENTDGSPLEVAVKDTISVTLKAYNAAGGDLGAAIRTAGNVDIAGAMQYQAVGTSSYSTLTYDFTIQTEDATPMLVLLGDTTQIWIDEVTLTHEPRVKGTLFYIN